MESMESIASQLEDAKITIIQLEYTVESMSTEICELQHAQKCATEVSEFETLSEERMETLESKASELRNAKITIIQLVSTVESKSSEIWELEHGLEKCATDVSEFETLSEEQMEILEFKATQL
ncbi:unnamed protein product [Albugo candida]|uniref:Uncharacterized protein n=1 Tax=Albugo candida TaxID=65357 RepID=A0A024FUZ4_9STRA|nr:unnamed protein product [Albugo candida]|eukprot:CCI10866.1 unnamed protein product [Albugo candida]